ncbi:hypothetical protein UB44_21765 [Burkholderiaceae bacterium 26]|nr:hypothetical protein UB44_21765 [Burkholderiaceae bacterium 26]
MRKNRLVRHSHQTAAAGADVSGSLEQDVALEGYPGIAVVGATALQRNELSLDERFDIGAIQIVGFSAVVDEKQNGKFMGTQHSCLQLVYWSRHATRDWGGLGFH